MTDPATTDVIRRGLRRRCPRCGVGPLFRGWFSPREDCDHCGLTLRPRPGDTWGFWVVGDRIFVFVPIVLLYFGVRPATWWGKGAFLLAVLVPLVATIPHRMGVCIGLDYLVRRRTDE